LERSAEKMMVGGERAKAGAEGNVLLPASFATASVEFCKAPPEQLKT